MTPDMSHSDIVGRVANKVRVKEGGPKYLSSDALPAPDILELLTPRVRSEKQRSKRLGGKGTKIID